jgi:ATP-dependent RNA helicase RhlB
MDLRQFGIDERLLAGAPCLGEEAPFLVKMLSHALLKGENICARLALSEGREAACLLPALQWLATAPAGEKRRVLCLGGEAVEAERMAAAARELGAGIGLESVVLREGGAAADEVAAASSVPLVAGTLDALLAASESGQLDLASFGYLLVDRGDRVAELPGERLKKFSSALRPSWERKVIVACDRISAKAKNLAWDLSDSPVEVHVEEGAARAQSILQETWHMGSEEKLRFLLGLLARRKPRLVCVFCNLKAGAEELALRLRYNGVDAEYILGALPRDKKLALLSDLKAAPGSILVLTDEGAEGLPEARFPLVVSFDIPLDPELYVKRISMLDKAEAGASVVNLACERYVYGLPAVEQYIDAKLDARPVEEDMLRAEDKSAGLAFEGPHPGDEAGRGDARGSRAGRLVALGENRGENRGAERREGGARQGGRPSGGERGPRREGPRGDRSERGRADHSPAIRQSIADITGGSLDVDALPVASREPGQGRPAGRGDRAQSGASSGKRGPKRSGSQDRREDGGGRRSSSSRPAQRQGGQGSGNRHQGDGRGRGRPESADRGQGSTANPYELSMEERMARYREKYAVGSRPASGQGRGGQSSKPGKGEKRGQGPDKSGQARPELRSDAAGREAIEHKADNREAGTGPAPRQQDGRGAGKAAAASAQSHKAAEGQGFWSRLFGSKTRK